MAIYAINHDDL